MTMEAIKKKVVPILKRQGVIKAAVFGSFARGEETKNSDIDFLMKITKNKTLFDLIQLKLELEKNSGEVSILWNTTPFIRLSEKKF